MCCTEFLSDRGFTALVEIASRFHDVSPCCVSLSFYICISIFLPLLLISLRRNGRVGGFLPSLELVPQCIPENREELVGSGQCVFCQKLRL